MIPFLLLAAISAHASPSPDFLADLELFKARSLTLRTEREREGSTHTATLSRLLQITPGVSVGVGKSETRVKSDLTGEAKTNFDYWRATADWNLFRGFSDAQAWSAARLAEEAQKFQVVSQELRTELEGSEVIFQWLYLHEVRGANEELVKLKLETMRIGRDRYRQGKIPLQEVVKMEVDLSQKENVLRQSEIDLAQNEANYKAFFVDDLKTSRWPLAEGQELVLEGAEGSFATKTLRSRASSAEYSWLSARSKHWPSLDFALNYREAPLRAPNAGTWSGTLELSLPLWSRFEIAASAAAFHSSFVEAEGVAATAERTDELRKAFLQKKIVLSQANLKEARLNLEKSERLYKDMLRSFQLGRLSTNELFQEQDRRIQALFSYSSSKLAFHESLMEACVLWGLSAKACLR